jgi:flagellar biogenesis protein FliO
MIAVVVLWAASPCSMLRADDDVPVPDAAGRTASNQSITIDPPPPTLDSEAPASGEGESDPEAMATQHAETADQEKTEKPPLRLSGPVRRSRAETVVGGERPVTSAFDVGSLVALGVVLLIVVAVFWFLRKLVPSLRHVDHAALQVVARASVSPKHNVALIRLGRRYILIGVGGDRMNRLCEVSEPQEVAELTAHFGGTSHGPGSVFSQLLARETQEFDEVEGVEHEGRRRADRTSPLENDAERIPGLIRLRQRLRSLKAG